MKLPVSILIISGLILNSLPTISQNLEGWSPDTLELANTARDASYLTVEEKKVIQLMNLARLDGKAFAKKVATPYIINNGLDKDEYVVTLQEDLQSTHSLHMLKPHAKLSESAAHHAYDMGHHGMIGHESSDGTTHLVRMHRYHVGEKMAESLCYGYNDPVDIVMQLLLDEAIPARVNRYHIIGQYYHHVGVSIKPHREYDHNAVLDFSSH
jgi:uncharacterized protein YkwD